MTDTRPESLPPRTAVPPLSVDATSGRGLLLVDAYADRWGRTIPDAHTKTVWAEVFLHPSAEPARADAADHFWGPSRRGDA
ncbi:hypothetical protein SALBM135S_03651 [Streptomyces alboniger]